MELRQLRYFLKAGELLHFTRAAEAVNISQSTLSQQIRQLEDELGTPLFDRIGKRVLLTEAGTRFLVYARQTVASADSGLEILRDLAGLETGDLRIGVTYTLRTLLTPALVAFSTAFPGVYINILFATSEELAEKLLAAEIDLALSFREGGIRDDSFDSEPLFESRMALIAAEGTEWTDRQQVTLPEIGGLPLVLPVRGYSTRQFLNQAFAEADVRPNIRMELNDIPTLLDLVRTGHWHTILSMATVTGQSGLTAIPIEGAGMNRQASLVWLRSAYRKKAALRLSELLTGPHV